MAYEFSVIYAASVAYCILWLYRRFFVNNETNTSAHVRNEEKAMLEKQNEELESAQNCDEIQRLETCLRQLEEENEQLRMRLEAIQNQTVEMEEDDDHRKTCDIDNVISELETVKKELEEVQRANIRLQQERDDVEYKKRRLEADCDAYRTRCDKMERENTDLINKIARLEGDLRSMIEGKNTVEKKRIAILEKELKKKEEELKEENRKRNESLHLGNKFVQQKIAELEKDKARISEVLQTKIKHFESQLKKAEEETRQVHNHYMKLKEKIHADNATVMAETKGRHEAELFKIDNQKKRAQLETQALREQHAARYQKIEAVLSRELQAIESTFIECTRRLDENPDILLKTMYESIRKVLERLVQEVQDSDRLTNPSDSGGVTSAYYEEKYEEDISRCEDSGIGDGEA